MKHDEAIVALSALGDDLRLKLYRLLVKRGPEGYPAGDLGERLGLAPSNLSFHLKVLTGAGLIASRRDGRFVVYSARFEQMDALVAFLTENCCSLGSAGTSDCAPTAGRAAGACVPARGAAATTCAPPGAPKAGMGTVRRRRSA